MQINKIEKNNIYKVTNNAEKQCMSLQQNAPKKSSPLMCSYPQNYYVSFGVRDFNTVYNDHKNTEMPTTVRNYIENQQCLLSDADFETFSKLGLKIIQRSAFSDLKECMTVSDIKEKYPNEEDFQNLKTLPEISTNSRFFGLMKQLESKGIKTLKCKEDVTTFLVKKVYLEGKTYKGVLEDLDAVITPEAKELKEKLATYTEARGHFFSPLGLKVPNGQTYGRDLQNSDPTFLANRQKYFSNLSPEEVNEKIQNLLKGSEKAQVSMMDAWNHCPQIRMDLSEFLTTNINNLNYNSSGVGNLDVYDEKFYSKMRRLMLGFWNKYPMHKEELGKEIKLALERYDKMKALGEEEYNNYVVSVQEKSKEIRNSIQLGKENISEKYPQALELLDKIAQKANPMIIKTKKSAKDFSQLLVSSLTMSELAILQGSDSTSEYRALFPEGIKIRMREIVQTPEYANFNNAQNLAFLQELLVENLIDKNTIDSILNGDKSINESIKQLYAENSSNSDINSISRRYDKYKAPLSTEEKVKIKKELLLYNPDFDITNHDKLDSLLSTQGKYMKCISGHNYLKELTQKMFWTEYDKKYGTDYSDVVLENINFDNLVTSAIEMVDEMNFPELD